MKVKVVGSGRVKSADGKINCTSTCTATYPVGTGSSLTASTTSANVFSGYSGVCSGRTCRFSSNGKDLTITATFTSCHHRR